MANLNDFKNINLKSKMYFSYLNLDEKDESVQARLGFYLFAIECISNITDINSVIDSIIDNDFVKKYHNETNNDLGIDAVTFDDDNNIINLYNFKFREKFNTSNQSENDVIISSKFLLCLNNENTANITKRTKEKIKSILSKISSDSIWNIRLNVVSNDGLGLVNGNDVLKTLENTYGLEVHSYSLDDIINFLSLRPKPFNATIIVNKDATLKYQEQELSSESSYLVRINLLDLIRITCNNEQLRNKYDLENYLVLRDVKFDYGVLFDNVRGYLGETNYNSNIEVTLENEPSKFFMYNNGITMTAKNVVAVLKNANKKCQIDIQDFQIVNGGQSIRSIYNFAKNNFDVEILSNAEILLRVFSTASQEGLTNKIAEYTNSQNAISAINLKSLSLLQIQIEQNLRMHSIFYVRKVGDLGSDNIEYKYRISMEKFAQITYSLQGFPDRASNQKMKLFTKYYDDIFGDKFTIEKAHEYVMRYYDIIEAYSKTNLDLYDQKNFYCVFLTENGIKINDAINHIEDTLKVYKNTEDDKNISDSRKLLQVGFKEALIKRAGIFK